MANDDGLRYAIADADLRDRLTHATRLLHDARAILDSVCIVLASDDYTERRVREAYHFTDRAHDCVTDALMARDVGEGMEDVPRPESDLNHPDFGPCEACRDNDHIQCQGIRYDPKIGDIPCTCCYDAD